MPPRAGRSWLITGLFAALLCLAQAPPVEEPPEEDEALAPKEYAYNPLQAKKEVQIGRFYLKKGSYKAAAGRFREATKWDEKYAEAYLLLGEACEKLKDDGCARQAYERFLVLAPKAKEAERVRKYLARQR